MNLTEKTLHTCYEIAFIANSDWHYGIGDVAVTGGTLNWHGGEVNYGNCWEG